VPDNYAVRLDRDTVTATGPESSAFLQGQLSQDVQGLQPGQSGWSLVLAPQGKIDALVRITRLPGDDWLLDTDRGWGEPLVQRLNRFKLRTKVEIEQVPWSVLGLRGAGSRGVRVEDGSFSVAAWPGVEGVDLIGPQPREPEGWKVIEGSENEAARILSGMPKMGIELDEKTIPAETGLVALTVSFTKGCYTGQELVARVDSRGSNVPRRLRLMRPSGPLPAGAELVVDDGSAAGTVTSVAQEPSGLWVALGYTKRGVEVPATLAARVDGHSDIEVSVEELPV
jgi:folate-binding protein YgfZ